MLGRPAASPYPAVLMPCEFCQLRLRYPDVAEIATYLPGATFGPRRMRDWEFVWMVEGDAVYQWNNAKVKAPEGAIVLCRPGGIDAFEWDKNRRTRHGYFHFDLLSIPGTWPAVTAWPFVRLPRDGDLLRSTFRYLLTPGRKQTPAMRLAVMQMLAAFVFGEFDSGDIPRETLPRPVDTTLRHIHRVLQEDASTPLSLNELAKVGGVTPEHLCRLFRSATGYTPSTTLRMARLDRALILLARSNYGIGEIAAMCGFGTQFHFSRRFREAFGATPREMRLKIDAGETPPVPLLKKWGV
jgi:AraC family transcriptional regulator